mmetsp:Transcript_55027/g.87829  ORF Transcript_55027/g.87829 Transcript_55027/m.87829 type:complete len:274 (-) Transcript_55027:310-1131(-)
MALKTKAAATDKETAATSKTAAVLCLYASDSVVSDNELAKALYLRHSPFSSDVTHNKGNQVTMKQLLRHDETDNVYYFPVGVPPERLAFNTSHWEWPQRYTVIMWLRWKRNSSCITTFDSSSNTPIYGTYGQLGCASSSQWLTLDNYRMTYDSWQFVAVFGGDGKSTFYVGDLSKEPENIGSVQCCISGKTTYRIGNGSQGPGDIACIYVFDRHVAMEELTEIYKDSIITMGEHWSKHEVELIRQMLAKHLEIDDIVRVVFELILGGLLDRLI